MRDLDAPLRHPRAERTRRALICAGRRLFSERPVDAVTVDDIVLAAEVGKGSFYNHFADRETLAREVVDEIRARIERCVEYANAEIEDPARRMARAVCTYFRFVLDEPERAGVIVRVCHGAPVSSSTSAPLNRGLVDDIAAGLQSGRFAVPTIEAGVLFVHGVTQVTFARLVENPAPELAVSLAQQISALLLSGLGLPGPESNLLAAQASDEIVRRGAFADRFEDVPEE